MGIQAGSKLLTDILRANGGSFKMDDDGYIDCFDDIDQNILEQLMEAALSNQNDASDDETVFEELIAIYPIANNEIQSMILGSIGAVYKNEDLLQNAVEFVLSHKVRLNVKGHGMASLRRCYGREQVWNDLLMRSHGAPRQVGMASTFAKQSVYNLVYSFYFGSHNGMILRLPESKERIIKSVLEKIALNIKFLKSNKFKMMKWIKNYMESKGDETASALMEEYDVNSDALNTDVHKSHLSRKQKRYKKQINGV